MLEFKHCTDKNVEEPSDSWSERFVYAEMWKRGKFKRSHFRRATAIAALATDVLGAQADECDRSGIDAVLASLNKASAAVGFRTNSNN